MEGGMWERIRRVTAAIVALAYLTACAGNFGGTQAVVPERAAQQLDGKGKLWLTTQDGAYVLEHTWVASDSVFGMRPDGQSMGLALSDVREVRTWHGGGWKTAGLVVGIYAALAAAYAVACAVDDGCWY
jgi:hypothetical protein